MGRKTGKKETNLHILSALIMASNAGVEAILQTRKLLDRQGKNDGETYTIVLVITPCENSCMK